MQTISALLMVMLLLAAGCSQSTEDKLKKSVDQVETKLAEGKAEAKRVLEAALARWEELRPEAERALASLERRVEALVNDSEALKKLPPEAVARVRARVEALRERLSQASADHEAGRTDLAVEKVDDVQRETAQIEELLVERPDPR